MSCWLISLNKLGKMREAFISILALVAIATPMKCSDVGKDGFNFYKDYLRARSDEALTDDDPSSMEPVLYFYRTPVQLHPGLMPVLEQEYRKRTGNVFKNHMLSKEFFGVDDQPRKRGSKTALSLMMQGKHHPHYTDEGHYCPYGK